MFLMSHGMGGYGMTPKDIDQILREKTIPKPWPEIWNFLLVSLVLLDLYHLLQKLWFPNQNVKDPDNWTLPQLRQLIKEYKNLVDDFKCDIQEFITVQNPPDPTSNILHLSPLTNLHWLCARSWLVRNPVNMEITRSSGGGHHTTLKVFFFLQNQWCFSIFNRVFHCCCGET